MDSNKKAKEDVVAAKESANQANTAQSQAEDYRAMKEVFESLNSDAEELPRQDFVPDFLFKGGRINEWGEKEPSVETDGNYFLVSIEAHDLDSADNHRQWFLTRWLYESGRQQYTWEPLEIFGDGDNLPHVINYFERVIVKHNVTMLQKPDLEQAASFIKGVDDDNWPEEDVTMENDELPAAPENKDQEKIQMIKRVLGYKLPPATPGNSGVDRTRFRRPKYYVEWMDGSITLQPSNLMEKALGDVANLHIDMSQSSHFPNKNWRRKKDRKGMQMETEEEDN